MVKTLLVLLLPVACLAADPGDVSWITAAGGTFTREANGKITAVDLRSSWVTDSDMPRLARLTDVARINLSQTRISDPGLRALKSLPAVTDLDLYFAEQITDEGMMVVQHWKRLERLVLRGTKITDSTLEVLAGLPSLRSLDLGYAQITDTGFDHLTSLTNLRELMMGGNKLTDVALQFLRQMPQLTHLDVGGTQRTDSGLWNLRLTESGVESIATVTDLQELRIAGTTVSARELRLLKGLPKLERLTLQGCRRVTDEAIPMLAALARLRRLDLNNTGVTEEGAAKLRQLLPQCEILR